jgi:hypothetical protein
MPADPQALPPVARSIAQARHWFLEFPGRELRLTGRDGRQTTVDDYLAAVAWFDQHGEPDAASLPDEDAPL